MRERVGGGRGLRRGRPGMFEGEDRGAGGAFDVTGKS
jgi:hypothetical protein